MEVVDGIVDRICDRTFTETDVDRFWEATDVFRGLLEAMAKGRRFGEYVLDIDPKLITEAQDA